MSGVRETEIDGVLCFWVATGRPASRAQLLFRQGLADEPLPEAGWLHLVEHLALLDRETLSRPVDGTTDMLVTTFRTHDSDEAALAGRLRLLAQWFAEPDLRLLARERGVLQAEAQLRADPLVRSLTWRYGAAGPGVAGYAEVGAVRATPELLEQRCRRVFNASNAVLVLDGPPPPGLTLPLPAGEYLPPAAATAVPRPHPASYLDDAGMTLSGVVPRSHEADVLTTVLELAVHDELRRRNGGVYAPWARQVDVDDRYAVLAAGSDVVPEMLATVAESGFEISRRLAHDGVPRAWLDEAVELRIRDLEAPGAEFGHAVRSAQAVLSDRLPTTHEELLAQVRGTDAGLVDAAARAFHASLLLGVPEDAVTYDGAPLVSFPETTPAEVGTRHHHVDWPAELTTFAAEDGAIEMADGAVAHRIEVGDVAGVLTWRDGTRRVVARDGTHLEMEPRQWSGGQELTAALDRMLPKELTVPMPDREVTFRRMGPAQKCAVAFSRVANTLPGLTTMVAVSVLLTLLLLRSGHTILGVVFLVLVGALAAQLVRLRWHPHGRPGDDAEPRHLTPIAS